eukprot:8317079-Alexandrium_andersonii.AAC.1
MTFTRPEGGVAGENGASARQSTAMGGAATPAANHGKCESVRPQPKQGHPLAEVQGGHGVRREPRRPRRGL